MHEAVSDILHRASARSRRHQPHGAGVAVRHALLIATLVLMPGELAVGRPRPRTSTPMMITLSSAGNGPDAGGLDRRFPAGRCRREAPAEAKPTPVAPPAPRRPRWSRRSRPRSRRRRRRPKLSRSRSTNRPRASPTTGRKSRPATRGSTPAARRFRSAGSRVRPDSGAASGSAFTDYADFCCPELPESDGGSDQAQLEPEPGRERPGADEVHHPARRHGVGRAGRETEQHRHCSTSSRSARS